MYWLISLYQYIVLIFVLHVFLDTNMGSNLSVDESVRVVIVGGGFAGIAAAGQLKSHGIPFVLVDMKDSFHHNVGALRASVESGKTYLMLYNTVKMKKQLLR